VNRALAALLGLALAGQAAPPAATIADLAWMSGTWASGDPARWTEEHWSAPRGGTMMGYSRSGRGEALREWEFLRIAPGPDGALAYQAQPGGRPAVLFRLVAHDGASATFENPAHDFPQRIRYVRDRETMTATISRIDGSNAMSWSFRRR
jgi:hypothetical protein